MPRIEEKWKNLSWAVSVPVAAAVLFLRIFRQPYASYAFHHGLVTSMIIALLPPAILDFLDYRWRKAIDRALPRLLEGVAHGQLTGLSLIRAFKEASDNVPRPLRDEIKLMLAKVSWGLSLEEALKLFERRARTPLAHRVATLIVEANRSGGYVERIFAPMAEATSTFQAMEDERKAELKPYIIIMYLSFVIFLIVTGVLYTQFFAPITTTPMPFLTPLMDPMSCWILLYHMGVVLAVFSGLIAGILGEGRFYGGLKHIVVMLLMALVAFKQMVEPGWFLRLLGLA